MKTSSFIISLILLPFLIYSNNVRITNINASKYPKIEFEFNTISTSLIKHSAIKLYENDSIVNILNISLRTKPLNKNLALLILIEDMSEKTHPGQRKFTKYVLLHSLHKFLKKGDRVNIVIFNRSYKTTSMIHLLLKHYTDDIDSISNVIMNYKAKNDIFYQQLSSDLYYAIFDGLNEIERSFPNNNKALLVFSAGKNNPYSQEVVPDRPILFSNAHRIPVYLIQYYIPGWEHNRITALIKGTNGKEVLTNKENVAIDSITSFINQAPSTIQGKTYKITFKSKFPKNGKVRYLNLVINGVPHTFQYVSPTMKFKDYYHLIISKPKYWISLILILLLLFILIGFFIHKKKKSNKKIKKTLIDLSNSKINNNNTIAEYKAKLEKLEKELNEKKEDLKANRLFEKIQEKNLHGIYPRLLLKINDKSSSFPITNSETYIGRSKNNDIVIDNLSISRKHCVILFDGETFAVKDLNSANGTFVNNTRVRNQVLKHGDIIKIGSIEISYIE